MWQLRVSPRDLARQALDAVFAHRLRSALSIVGIVFGIATVVAALAIGEGARRAALAEISALGIDNLYVRATVPGSQAAGRRPLAPVLSLDDVRVITETLESERAVSAARIAHTEVRFDSRRTPGSLAGVTTSWRAVADIRIAAGRWLSPADLRSRRRVAVIGGGLAHELFAKADPIGARVLAGGNWYYIVGRLPDRAHDAAPQVIESLDTDRSLLVPLGAMDLSLGAGDGLGGVQEIGVRMGGADEVERAAQVLAGMMNRRHPGVARHELVVPRELLAARVRARRSFTVVLVGIGALALLISGVGIMNVMLASVAERTQEVGVRRAFGARRAEIIVQFTMEAATLCVVGALAGVPLGAALSGIVTVVAGWPVSVSLGSILLALVLATVTGLVFGVYPAYVAAEIEPIDALRAP